jgi:hypothetical protein
MGLLTSANHPVRTAKSMVASGWSTDPSEAFGTTVFDVGLDLLTGGAGAGAGAARRTFAAGAKDAMEAGVERGAREGIGTAAESTGESAAKDVAKDGLPDGWTLKQGQEAADVTADAAKDVARDKWGHSAGTGDGSPATEAGNKSAAPDWDDLKDPAKHQSAMADISDGAVTFNGNADALQYGAKHWNDYAENLPADQQAAVRSYTGPEYQKINGFLRGNDYYDTPVVRQQIEQIDRALAGNRLPEDVIVTRGTDLGHYLEKMATNNPRDMVGEVFNEEAYMSTSLGDTVFSNKEAVLHLRAPEGTPGLWVEKLSHYGADERELLLGRGNEYTITKAFKDANGQWQIYGKIHR